MLDEWRKSHICFSRLFISYFCQRRNEKLRIVIKLPYFFLFRRITTLCKYENTFQYLLLSNTTYTLLYIFFLQNYFLKFYAKHPRCILFNLIFLLSNKHLNTVVNYLSVCSNFIIIIIIIIMATFPHHISPQYSPISELRLFLRLHPSFELRHEWMKAERG